MSMVGVILAGTAGSYFGSALNYWASRWVGQPVISRYGKYFLLPPKKLAMAENWVLKYGAPGVFAARLLPVIRHLISIPAGVLKMPFGKFTWATIIGAGLWCAILSWFGQEVIGSHPELLQSPEAMVGAIKDKMHSILAAILLMGVLYVVVQVVKKKATGSLKEPLAQEEQ